MDYTMTKTPGTSCGAHLAGSGESACIWVSIEDAIKQVEAAGHTLGGDREVAAHARQRLKALVDVNITFERTYWYTCSYYLLLLKLKLYRDIHRCAFIAMIGRGRPVRAL